VILCQEITVLENGVRAVEETEENEKGNFKEFQSLLDKLNVQKEEIHEEVVALDRKLEEIEDTLLHKITEKRTLTSNTNVLKEDNSRISGRRRAVKHAYRDVRRKVGQLQRLQLEQRPSTPRPDWQPVARALKSVCAVSLTGDGLGNSSDKDGATGADCADLHVVAHAVKSVRDKPLNLDQPSAMVAGDVLADIEVLKAYLSKVQEALPWVQAAKKQQQLMENKWFICRGSAPNVPKFLRMQGKVRNRDMQKAEAEAFVADFWKARTIHNKDPKKVGTSSPGDFLYALLKKKFGVPSAMAEAAYNLIDACQRYSYDADCELFTHVIFGDLCEEARDDQEREIERFKTACRRMDRKINKSKSKMNGLLKRAVFMELVDTHFTCKSQEDLQSLRQGVMYDQPLPVITYTELFEENDQGDQGKVCKQSLLRSSCWPCEHGLS
jgi:hypothetical protein